MNANRTYRLGALVALVATLSCVAVLSWLEPMYAFFDFDIYRNAGEAVLEQQSPYAFEPLRHFQYAPAVALVFAGLAALPAWLALALYYTLLGQGWWLALHLTRPERRVLGFAVFVAAYAVPFWLEFRLGQVNVVPVLGVFGAAALVNRGDARGRLLAGVLLGLALWFKLYALAFFPILLLKRRFDVLAIASVVLGIGSVALGLHEARTWFDLLAGTTEALVDHRYNASLHGVATKWLGVPAGPIANALGIVAFLAAVFRGRDRSWRWHAALALAFVPLIVPVAWSYWILLGFPALALATDALDERRTSRQTLCLVLLCALGACTQSDVAYYGGTVVAAALTIAVLEWAPRETAERDRDRGRQPPS